MAGGPKSDKALREYSKEHLHYEIEMLIATGARLQLGAWNSVAEKNACIESFVIHVRNLIAFLYPTTPKKGDVVAADFFDSPRAWSSSTPSSSLKQARFRANKEVGHLTTSRISGTPARKGWPVVSLIKEILAELTRFEAGASKKRLDPSVGKVLWLSTPVTASGLVKAANQLDRSTILPHGELPYSLPTSK
jgi:hypothetical protein